MYWIESLGRVELNITKSQAARGYHSGPCDDDVRELSEVATIARQLRKIDPETLRDSLREYGAWDDEELENHAENLQRILWLACADIVDGTN